MEHITRVSLQTKLSRLYKKKGGNRSKQNQSSQSEPPIRILSLPTSNKTKKTPHGHTMQLLNTKIAINRTSSHDLRRFSVRFESVRALFMQLT